MRKEQLGDKIRREAKDILSRVCRKDNTDDEWLRLEKNIQEFREKYQKEDLSPKLIRDFGPLGCGEMVGMICDGIKRNRGMITSGKDAVIIDCRKKSNSD